MVFSTANHVQQLLDCGPKCPVLKMIVSMDSLDPSTKAKYEELSKERGITILELKQGKD